MTAYTFDQLITFTRTSAATYVGSNGLVAVTPASRNLLTYTQDFDNAAWTKVNTTATANSVAAPDGTLTGDALIENSSTAIHNTLQNYTASSGQAYTLSVYAKLATGSRYLTIATGDGSCAIATFDLQTGTISGAAAVIGANWSTPSAQIIAAGNGWYRCSVSGTSVASGSRSAYFTLNSTSSNPAAGSGASYAGDGTSGFYLWGAQLEAASAASTYTRNNGGVYPPRFDYDPVTRAPRGLLIEEQRTNLLVRSEEFDNASWSKVEATVTTNAIASPDGTVDADKFIPSTNAAGHYMVQTVTSTTSQCTGTVYVKLDGSAVNKVTLFPGSSGSFANFNLSTLSSAGEVNVSSTSITDVGNGWYRLSATWVAGTTINSLRFYASSGVNGAAATAGDGTSGIYVWGAQLEVGSFATSYIPTVASQVTRTADVAAITAPMFAPWYRQSEGTFVVQAMTAIGLRGGSQGMFSANDGTTSNVMNAARLATGFVRFNGTGSPAGDVTSVASAANGAVSKMAFAFKANDWAMSLNGAAAVTDTSAVVPAVTRLGIGSLDGLFDPGALWGGHIQSIDYYPTRLTNAQIQALTA